MSRTAFRTLSCARVRVLLLSSGGMLFSWSSAAGQVNYKLSAALTAPPNVEGDVRDARISSDGRRIVYLADQDTLDVVELYSVPLDASSSAVKLNGALVREGGIDSYQISADARRVVYLADQERSHVHELFSVPIDGSAGAIKLSGTLEPEDDVIAFALDPHGRRVVFNTGRGLHSVPIVGSSPARSLIGLHSSGQVSSYDISPDGRRVVFIADVTGTGVFELYGTLINGGLTAVGNGRKAPPATLTKLNSALIPRGDVRSFRIGADGRAVLYQADQETDEVHELYSVPIEGGAIPRKLSAGVSAFFDYQLSADGRRAVYRASQDGAIELYSAPTDAGSSPIKLNGPLVPNGSVIGFSLGGTRVVYRADQDVDNDFELFSVPLDGSASAVQINAPLAHDASVPSFQVTPDGSRIVLALYHRVRRLFELQSAPIAGGSDPIRLGPPLALRADWQPRPDVFEFQITPDSQRVVFLTDQLDGGAARLYGLPIDGSAGRAGPVRLSGSLAVSRHDHFEFDFALSPVGGAVVFLADRGDTVLELYGAPIDASASPFKLNPRLAFGRDPGDVSSFQISPDGRWAVYRADQESDQDFELFAVPVGARSEPVKLNGPVAPGNDVDLFQVSPDSRWAVYRADLDVDERFELYSARLDGSSGPLELSGALAPGGDVFYRAGYGFEISADSSRVVYFADQDANEVYELYSVPIDASATPVKLNGPLVPGGDVLPSRGRLTPDGSRVVYVADQDSLTVGELFSAPIDGSAPPLKISGPMTAGGNVLNVFPSFNFVISPDGSRVVYVADAESDEVYELYSAPLDGSADPVRLNAPLVAGGDVPWYGPPIRISPDGSRVVYVADQEADEVFELFSVPIDASSLPVKLNGPMVAGGDVDTQDGDFQISPDGSRVVYLADQTRNGRFELFSVPIDGGQAPLELNSDMASLRDVKSFALGPGGGRAVYVADEDVDDVFELYSVPLDASLAPVKLNDPLPFGGDVFSFQISPDGERVAFLPFGWATREVHWVPLDRSREPVVLNGPLVPGGGVSAYQISPDGWRMLYLADQQTDEMFELYASALRAPARANSP